jgi:thioredoxin reductase (NADPH)
MTSTVFDITIIGGGPVGLFTAAIAGEMGAACNIIESRFHLGGIMMAAYPDKDVYNFPGITSIKGRDLINDLISKAQSDGLVAHLGEYVHDISMRSKGVVVIKSNKSEYVSSAAIIATGLIAHYSPFVDMIKIKDWNGTGIYDNWPQVAMIKGKKVAVILGQTTNLDIPPHIRQAAERVYLIYDERWMKSAPAKTGDNVMTDSELYQPPWIVREIGGNEIPENAILENDDTGERRLLPLDAAVGIYESQARQTVYSNLGIEMVSQRVRVDQRMQTSLKRVFAAGDIAWYPGKVMLLSAGIYEARIAVKNALKLI